MASFNSINKAMIMGRLGRDPELRASQSGTSIVNFSVATSERKRAQDGTFTEKTEWHNIVAFGNIADNCGRFIKKGSLVFVEGKIQTRSYTDKSGVEKYRTEILADSIHFLDSRDSNQSNQNGNGQNFGGKINTDMGDMDDDDLPF
jgi:single-strand DNA-binding protein